MRETSIDALEPRRAQLTALQRETRRPSLAGNLHYLRCYSAHDAPSTGGDRPLVLLLATEGGALVGFLALRRRPPKYGSAATIGSLVTHHGGCDLIARPADEARCADAFRRYLLDVEPGWSKIEIARQHADSPLFFVPDVDDPILVRRTPSAPHIVLPLPYASFNEYWTTRAATFRSSVGRNVRKLFAAGRVELVRCDDVRGAQALLDLHVELEARSWKARATPPLDLGRAPARLAFYRALLAPDIDPTLSPHFAFVLLDGALVAGMFAIDFAGTSFWQEIAHDDAFERLGPGAFVVLLGIWDALERGAATIDFGFGVEQYKARWGGEVSPTWNLELVRLDSLAFLRAIVGLIRRRRRSRADVAAAPVAANEAKVEVRAEALLTSPLAALAPLDGEARLRRIEAGHVRLRRLSGVALEAVLPLSVASHVATTNTNSSKNDSDAERRRRDGHGSRAAAPEGQPH
ncbi:MAG: GNAT family N-acetyltransferase [Polyangiales bacterium]